MRFEQLRYLEAALRTGSFRQAARELGVSQPTITTQVQRLEEDLGVVLVSRGAQGVSATYAAERILPHAKAAIRAEDLLRQEVSAIGDLKIGTIRIATVVTGGMVVLPHIVKRLLVDHPNIRFEVTEQGGERVLKSVASGKYDLGIITRLGENAAMPEIAADQFGETKLHFIDLMTGRLALCVPDDHRLAHVDEFDPAELAGEPLIFYPPGSVLRAAFERLLEGMPARVVYTTDSADTAQRLVRAGVGIAIANTLAPTTRSGDGVTLLPINQPWARAQMSVVVRLGELRSAIVQTILRLIREESSFTPRPPIGGKPTPRQQ